MERFENIPLSDDEQKAIKEAAQILKSRFDIKEIVLFGSKARGTDDEHSDIDLLVIAAQPLNWKTEKEISGVLFDMGLTHNVIFSPLYASEDEWTGAFTEFPIYAEIMREGAVVL